MILDASAVVAVTLGEPDHERFLNAMLQAVHLRISAISVYEAGVVLFRRRGREAVDAMMALLDEIGVVIESFEAADAYAAIDVYAKFGKGIHPAGLNLGDCPVYVLAEAHRVPVLSSSAEFVRAGLKSASD